MSGGSWLARDGRGFAAIANDQPARTHTLVELIAIADGINHAVPTESEFTKAVGRLLSAGLIGADSAADHYWPTEAGTLLRQRWRHGLFGWINVIPPQLQRLGEPQDADWPLPSGAFEGAVREYLARWPKQ